MAEKDRSSSLPVDEVLVNLGEISESEDNFHEAREDAVTAEVEREETSTHQTIQEDPITEERIEAKTEADGENISTKLEGTLTRSTLEGALISTTEHSEKGYIADSERSSGSSGGSSRISGYEADSEWSLSGRPLINLMNEQPSESSAESARECLSEKEGSASPSGSSVSTPDSERAPLVDDLRSNSPSGSSQGSTADESSPLILGGSEDSKAKDLHSSRKTSQSTLWHRAVRGLRYLTRSSLCGEQRMDVEEGKSDRPETSETKSTRKRKQEPHKIHTYGKSTSEQSDASLTEVIVCNKGKKKTHEHFTEVIVSKESTSSYSKSKGKKSEDSEKRKRDSEPSDLPKTKKKSGSFPVMCESSSSGHEAGSERSSTDVPELKAPVAPETPEDIEASAENTSSSSNNEADE